MKIFFDLDGTLIDISMRHYEVYLKCAKAYNGVALSKNDYWTKKRSNASWSEILELSEIHLNEESKFMSMFVQLIESPEYLRIDKLFDATIKTLEILSYDNELILISFRRNRTALLGQLKDMGIDKYFVSILSGHAQTKASVFNKKFHIIKSIYIAQPEDMIVGDTEADVSAGKLLQIHTVSVTTGIRDKNYLKKYSPEFIISSIKELLVVVQSIKK